MEVCFLFFFIEFEYVVGEKIVCGDVKYVRVYVFDCEVSDFVKIFVYEWFVIC